MARFESEGTWFGEQKKLQSEKFTIPTGFSEMLTQVYLTEEKSFISNVRYWVLQFKKGGSYKVFYELIEALVEDYDK